MIIFIDLYDNDIKLIEEKTPKSEAKVSSIPFTYSLRSTENKIKAITEMLSSDEGEKLKKSLSNTLILPNDVLGLGTFDLPALSKSKLRDVFITRFRLCYPSYRDYYYNYFEYYRDQKGTVYFYELAKKDSINRLVGAFKNNGIKIKAVNIFASLLKTDDKNLTSYPITTLIIGEYDSELIIVKGGKILSINSIGYGSKVLLNQEFYNHSGYYFNNNEALCFSSFIKNNITAQAEVNDENILDCNPKDSLDPTDPKEIRLLKEDQLKQYNIKNNFRKYYAHVLEIVDFYAKSPWYFPFKEINVVASHEVHVNLIEAASEDNQVRFVDTNLKIEDIAQNYMTNSSLFVQKSEKERRKIDWKAFFTMEIGGKKKKD